MGFVEKWPSKMQRQRLFWKSSGAGIIFWVGPKTPVFFVGQLPLHVSTSHERLPGGRISFSKDVDTPIV